MLWLFGLDVCLVGWCLWLVMLLFCLIFCFELCLFGCFVCFGLFYCLPLVGYLLLSCCFQLVVWFRFCIIGYVSVSLLFCNLMVVWVFGCGIVFVGCFDCRLLCVCFIVLFRLIWVWLASDLLGVGGYGVFDLA